MERRTLWLVVGIMAACACAALFLAGGLLALLWALEPTTRAQLNTLQIASIPALGLALCLPLAVQAWARWRQRPSRPFAPPRRWWIWLALLLALLLLVAGGFLVSQFSPIPDFLLPAIHVLTMGLLSVSILGLAGLGLRGTGGSRREVVAAMASGGLFGTGTAAVVEILLVLVTVLVVLTFIAVAIPDGMARIRELTSLLEDPDALEGQINDVAFLQSLLSPGIILAALGGVAVIVPLIEETAKPLVIGIAGRWVRPHPARAFLRGVASGAGFALAENLLNVSVGEPQAWAFATMARLGTTAMHCLTSGLVGWGWGQLWSARRPLRLVGAYAAAVTIHGLWNGAAVGMVFLGLGTLALQEQMALAFPLALGALTLMGALLVMGVVMIAALPVIGWRLAVQADRSAVGQSEPSGGEDLAGAEARL